MITLRCRGVVVAVSAIILDDCLKGDGEQLDAELAGDAPFEVGQQEQLGDGFGSFFEPGDPGVDALM